MYYTVQLCRYCAVQVGVLYSTSVSVLYSTKCIGIVQDDCACIVEYSSAVMFVQYKCARNYEAGITSTVVWPAHSDQSESNFLNVR